MRTLSAFADEISADLDQQLETLAAESIRPQILGLQRA